VATSGVDLRTRLRFAAAGVSAVSAHAAAGAGVLELKDKGGRGAADAKWGILCSAPVVSTMQRADETKAKEKTKTVVDFMRERLEQQPKRSKPLTEKEQVEYEKAERLFRYDSLNEHLVQLSLTRAIKRREWRTASRLAIGWLLNHFVFVALLLIFISYGCYFEEMFSTAVTEETDTTTTTMRNSTTNATYNVTTNVTHNVTTEADTNQLLMYSWGWSMMQRFLINEPILIFFSVMIPLLFATECCANLCTESCNNVLGVAVAVVITFFKRMKRV